MNAHTSTSRSNTGAGSSLLNVDWPSSQLYWRCLHSKNDKKKKKQLSRRNTVCKIQHQKMLKSPDMNVPDVFITKKKKSNTIK
jgi:hypothetical protein